MNTAATYPGTRDWRNRFLLIQPSGNPTRLLVHDDHHPVPYYYDFDAPEELRDFVNQLRAGFTDLAPTGTLPIS
jgi:hypothetical protein